MRTWLLWQLDRLFPPDRSAYLGADGQTERELDRAAATTTAKYLDELPSTNIDVLDFGCGWGGEALWLADRVRSVVGVDVDANSIAHAAKRAATVPNCRFVVGTESIPSASVDVVLSTDTCEHVMDLEHAFRELYRVLRPGGCMISRFGPLFYSPQGYHLYWACQVPYAHVLLGLAPILALRNARTADQKSAENWRGMGLNQRRFQHYRAAVEEAGFEIVRFKPVFVRGVRWFQRIPWLRDCFIFGIDLKIVRPFGAGR